MNAWAELLISFFGLTALTFSIVGYYQCRFKKNAFGSFLPMNIIGAFVWGDTVVFGVFWGLVSLVVLIFNEYNLFWLVVSLFWSVRSLGEMIYWFNQQFSTKVRNPISNFPFLKSIFHNDSVWFIFQIYWQCILVLSIVSSLYFGKLWLATI